MMVLLQPLDVGRDRRRTRLDAAVIGLDQRLCHGGLAGRDIKKQPDVIMRRALVALQCQRVVAALMDNLLSDRTLAVEPEVALRWRHKGLTPLDNADEEG